MDLLILLHIYIKSNIVFYVFSFFFSFFLFITTFTNQKNIIHPFVICFLPFVQLLITLFNIKLLNSNKINNCNYFCLFFLHPILILLTAILTIDTYMCKFSKFTCYLNIYLTEHVNLNLLLMAILYYDIVFTLFIDYYIFKILHKTTLVIDIGTQETCCDYQNDGLPTYFQATSNQSESFNIIK